jgi:hypothetical protein
MAEFEYWTPHSVTRSVIGGEMGPGAEREGITEAARRLSHCLAEMAAVLETQQDEYLVYCAQARGVAQKARETVKEWGVL